ncbi:DUF3992 domain-containing protein [Bacillus tianshenii]|nr:DUF3992 domain-containing protein [Bacillus tianshenii]
MDTNRLLPRHCIKVDKVYDWISHQTTLKLSEFLKPKNVKDEICANFCIPKDEEPRILWKADEHINPSGTLTVCLEQGSIEVFVNGELLFSLNQGESRSITLCSLRSLEVRCVDEIEKCAGRFTIDLHYEVYDFKDVQSVKCILTDKDGNPVNPLDEGAVICEEVSDPEDREEVNITLPNQKTATLQKVEVLIRGFIVIETSTKNGKKKKTCPIPFHSLETFILCAPKGTSVECEITKFTCKALLIPIHSDKAGCKEIIISITLCQSIQTIAQVKVELEGMVCKPREEILASFCPSKQFPEDCPIVFK